MCAEKSWREEVKEEPGAVRDFADSCEGWKGPPVVLLHGGWEAANRVGECESGQKRTSGGGAVEVEDVVVDEGSERGSRGDRQRPLEKVVQGPPVGGEGGRCDRLKQKRREGVWLGRGEAVREEWGKEWEQG